MITGSVIIQDALSPLYWHSRLRTKGHVGDSGPVIRTQGWQNATGIQGNGYRLATIFHAYVPREFF